MAQLNEGDKDMKTGRDTQNAQMKALRKAQGTAVRQRELPPYIGKDKLPEDPKVESD